MTEQQQCLKTIIDEHLPIQIHIQGGWDGKGREKVTPEFSHFFIHFDIFIPHSSIVYTGSR